MARALEVWTTRGIEAVAFVAFVEFEAVVAFVEFEAVVAFVAFVALR
jgi:hypothetical protein